MIETPTKERAYKVIERPELHPEAWEYSDGSVRRPGDHGSGAYFVRQPPYAAVTIDAERSQELHERKRALKVAQEQEFKDEVQHALVSQVASGNSLPLRKTAAGEVAGWVGNLGAEMRQDTAPKEHGISNYVKVLKEVGQMAGLIKEKETGNITIDKAVILSAGTREHVEGLLQKLAAASGDDSRDA